MPAIGTTFPASIQFLDYSGERQSVSIDIQALDDTTFEDVGALVDTLVTAMEAITLGNVAKVSYGSADVRTNARPSDKTAQIESEMLVSCIDAATSQPFSFRLPTVDYAAFNYASPPAGDEVIVSGAGASAATLAFVAAVNAVARSPYSYLNAVIVVGMRVVK